MTIIPAILLASFIYSLYGYLCYNPELKNHSIVLWGGLACALMANACWIFLSKNTLDPAKLLFYGMIWDIMIICVTIGIPLFLFDAKFSVAQLIGLFVAISGLMIMKFGAV